MTDVVIGLLELTLVASIAVALVGLLRTPVRRLAGARATYGLWLMVPVSALTVLLPTLPHPITNTMVANAAVRFSIGGNSPNAAVIASIVWALGASIMLAFAVTRQRAFVRSLGSLSRLPDGTYRSASAIEPMVVGALRPRVIVPADFESRYTKDERALVLAHERAHVQRGDALANALATGWLCLSWFNPLMHWAIARFRFDQELACDALVLVSTGTARRRYADALLKTQLAADSPGAAVPAGCHWQATHPLTQRIAALKQPLPGVAGRWLGAALVLTLISSGSYAAWAVRPDLAAVEPDAGMLPAQVRQALLSLPVAREIVPEPLGKLIQITPPLKKTALRGCKLSRAKARTLPK